MPAAAFCPCPPLLARGATGGPVAEVERLRTACLDVVRGLLAAAPAAITLVGPDAHVAAASGAVRWPGESRGSLGGLGLADDEGDGGGLPLSLTVGRRLLRDGGFDGEVRQLAISPDYETSRCVALGRSLHDETLLVLADGSARRGEKPPGGPAVDATGYDARVSGALVAGDIASLRALDPLTSARLGADGRVGWQVLAGWADGRRVTAGSLLYDDAPFGVGYLVGCWSVP